MRLLLLISILLTTSCRAEVKVGVTSSPTSQSTAWTWLSKDFGFLEDAIKFINGLPENQRESAYVIALSSARSGMFTGYYSVIYKSK